MKHLTAKTKNVSRKGKRGLLAALAFTGALTLLAPLASSTPPTAHAAEPGEAGNYERMRGKTIGLADPIRGNHLPSAPSICDPATTEELPAYRGFCYPKRWADTSFKQYGSSPSPNLADWIAEDDNQYKHWDFVTPYFDDNFDTRATTSKPDSREGMQNVYISGQAFRSRWSKNRLVFVFHMKGRVPTNDTDPKSQKHSYFMQFATSKGLKVLSVEQGPWKNDVVKIFGRQAQKGGSCNDEVPCSTNAFLNVARYWVYPMKTNPGGWFGTEDAKIINADGVLETAQEPARLDLYSVQPGSDLYVMIHAEIDPSQNSDVDKYSISARASVNGKHGWGTSWTDQWNYSIFGYPNTTWFYRGYGKYQDTYGGQLNAARKSHKSVLATAAISKDPERPERPLAPGEKLGYPYYDENQPATPQHTKDEVDTYARQNLEKNGMQLDGTFVEDQNTAANAQKKLITKQVYETAQKIDELNAQRPVDNLIETSEGNQVINVRGEKEIQPALHKSPLLFDNTREYTDSFLTMNVDTPEKIRARYAHDRAEISKNYAKEWEAETREQLLQANREAETRELSQFKTNAEKGIFQLNMRVQGKDHKYKSTGSNYIFVLDRSGSMGDRSLNSPTGEKKIDVLKRTVKSAIDQLAAGNAQQNNHDDSDPEARKNNRFAIVTFGDASWIWNGGTYHVGNTVLSPNAEEAKAFIDTIEAGGDTNYTGALRLTENILETLDKIEPDNRRQTQVVFITDGEPTSSYKLERVFRDQNGLPFMNTTYETWGDFLLGSSFYKSLQSGSRYLDYNGARYDYLQKLEQSGKLGNSKIFGPRRGKPCTLSENCTNGSLELLAQHARYDVQATSSYPLRTWDNGVMRSNYYEPWCDFGIVLRPFETRNCTVRYDRRYIPILDPQKTMVTDIATSLHYSKYFGYNLPLTTQIAHDIRYPAGQREPDYNDTALRTTIVNYALMQTLDLYGGTIPAKKSLNYSGFTAVSDYGGYSRVAPEQDPAHEQALVKDHGLPTLIEIGNLRKRFPHVNFYAQAIPEDDKQDFDSKVSGMTHQDQLRVMRMLLRDGIAAGDPTHYAEVDGKNFDALFFKATYPMALQKRVNDAHVEYRMGENVKLHVPSVLEAEENADSSASSRRRRALKDPVRLVYGKDYTLETSTSFDEEWASKLDVVYHPEGHTVTVGRDQHFDLGRYDWFSLSFKLQADPEKTDVREGKYVLVARESGKGEADGAILHTRGPAQQDADESENPNFLSRHFVVPSVRVKARFADVEIAKHDAASKDLLTGSALDGLKFTLQELDDEGQPQKPQHARLGLFPTTAASLSEARGLSAQRLTVGRVYELTETSAPSGYGVAAHAKVHVKVVEVPNGPVDQTLPVPSGTSPDPAPAGVQCDENGLYSCARTQLRLLWRLPDEKKWHAATTYTGEVLEGEAGQEQPGVSWLSLHFTDPRSEGARVAVLKTGGPNGLPLTGSEFQLYAQQPSAEAEPLEDGLVADDSAVGEAAQGVQGASFRSSELQIGTTYWLVETRAPFGHNLLAEPVSFKVVNAEDGGYRIELLGGHSDFVTAVQAEPGRFELPTIKVRDVEVGHLPASGGRGVIYSLAAGLALLGVAFFLRRRQEA